MKFKIILFGAILTLFFSGKTPEDTWDEIQNKTWISSGVGPMGATLVFLQDQFGKRAVLQYSGSGCCQILTFVYNAEIVDDSVKLFSVHSSESLLDVDFKYYSTLIYSRQSNLLYYKNSSCNWKIWLDKPHLYKSCCTELEIEKLVSDTLSALDFR